MSVDAQRPAPLSAPSRQQRRAVLRQLEKGKLALSPSNLLTLVEGVDEKKWQTMGLYLGVPENIREEIQKQYPTLREWMREMFSYFNRLDPQASWRRIIRALDVVEETKLADQLRHLAEKVADPSFTVEAVNAVLNAAEDCDELADWLVIPPSIQRSIRGKYTSTQDQKKALAEYIVDFLPGATWTLLAGGFYCCNDETALKLTCEHFQKEEDSSLTLTNLLSILHGLDNWYSLGLCLGVPEDKLERIHRSYPNDYERLEALLEVWLAKHPAPSWSWLAYALYRRSRSPEHVALQRVYDKYIQAPKTTRRMTSLESVIKRKGSAPLNIAQGVLLGFPRAGKSSLKLRLLGKQAQKQTISTGVAEKVVRIEIDAAHISGKKWKPIIDLDEEAADLVDTFPEDKAAPDEVEDEDDPSEVEFGTVPHSIPRADRKITSRECSSNMTKAASFGGLSSQVSQPVALRRTMSIPTAPLPARDTIDYFEDAFTTALQREKEALATDEDDRFTLYLTDSGGQPEFQGLLRNMVSGPSLFFIVFRLDQELNETFTVEYQHPDGSVMTPYDTTLTTKEALLQFLATISSVGSFTKTEDGKEVRIKPKAIFVGTHRDKISEKKFREVDRQLRELVKTTDSYRDGIIEFASRSQLILPIDNLSEDDTDVLNIRAVVERVCKRGNDYKIETPYPTLILGIALRFLKDPIISYDYCFKRAQQCGIETTDELDDALWFLHHRVGLLRHFSDFPELKNLVILSPQYIFDKVTELVVSTFTFEKTDCSIEEEFLNKGIFPFQTFVDLTSSQGEFITPAQLVCLLERLHVIAPIIDPDGDEIKYFAPCVLAHADSAEEDTPSSSDVALPPLLFSFKSGYCPTGLFGGLVVHLLGSSKATELEWCLEEDRIYRDYITLSVGPHDTFSFKVLPSHMRIELVWSLKQQRKVSLEEVCSDVRRCIESALNEVVRLLAYTDKAEHQLAFPCPAKGHSDAAVIKFFKQKPAGLVCSKGKKRFDLPAGFEAWFSEESAHTPVSEKPSSPVLETAPAEIQVPELEHENRKMVFSEIRLGKTIGRGASGTVFKGGWKQWDIAIKQVAYDRTVDEEIRTVSALKHPKIIKLYGTAMKPPHLYIALELAECSLYKFIQDHSKQPQLEFSIRWAIDIAEGMSYLHEQDIVHRDLKSLNVLLCFNKLAKLCDFDTARRMDHSTVATLTGTSAWMAPEVILQEPYSKRCDLFSYGTVLWELVTHEVPFEDIKGAYNTQKAIIEGRMPPIPDSVDGSLSALIQKCWNQDPEGRPSFVEIISALNRKDVPSEPEQQSGDSKAEALSEAIIEHKNRKIEFEDLVLEELIGTGSFGTVFRGRWKESKRQVAIKKVFVGEEKEVFTLCDLKHPHIITLYGTASQHPHILIVTELAELGSLHGYMERHRGCPDLELSLQWATGVADAMHFLHEKDVVHRDLKSANVLLTSESVAKICDFGVSRHMDHTTRATMAGTLAWMAPEVILQAPYSKRCDLFSYGTVLWELVTHEVPFKELKGVPFFIQSAIIDGKMPRIPEAVESYLSVLIQRCWDRDPQSRPPFADILSVLKSKGVQEGEMAGACE